MSSVVWRARAVVLVHLATLGLSAADQKLSGFTNGRIDLSSAGVSSNNITAEMTWAFKAKTLSLSAYARLFDFGDSCETAETSRKSIFVDAYPKDASRQEGRIIFQIYGASGYNSACHATSNNFITVGQMRTYVFTVSKSAVKLYRDGVLMGSKGAGCSIPQVPRKYFFLGGAPCNSTGTDTRFNWNAELNWAGVFNKALSATEVQALQSNLGAPHAQGSLFYKNFAATPSPTKAPTNAPTGTVAPTNAPTKAPTKAPTTKAPTKPPTTPAPTTSAPTQNTTCTESRLTGEPWTMYMFVGPTVANQQYTGAIGSGHESNAIKAQNTALRYGGSASGGAGLLSQPGLIKTVSDMPTNGSHKMPETTFDAMGFTELLVVQKQPAAWVKIVHKNGSAFSSAEVFSINSLLSQSNPVLLDASWTSSRVTGKAHKFYGPLFMDSWGKGYGWMWGGDTVNVYSVRGTLEGTETATQRTHPAWTASNTFAWYGRGGRQSSMQKWYPQPAPKPCGAFMSLGFTSSPTAPKTKAPTTKAPTTKAPTTKAPTTGSPTTPVPTTSPTTASPSTSPTKAPTQPFAPQVRSRPTRRAVIKHTFKGELSRVQYTKLLGKLRPGHDIIPPKDVKLTMHAAVVLSLPSALTVEQIRAAVVQQVAPAVLESLAVLSGAGRRRQLSGSGSTSYSAAAVTSSGSSLSVQMAPKTITAGLAKLLSVSVDSVNATAPDVTTSIELSTVDTDLANSAASAAQLATGLAAAGITRVRANAVKLSEVAVVFDRRSQLQANLLCNCDANGVPLQYVPEAWEYAGHFTNGK